MKPKKDQKPISPISFTNKEVGSNGPKSNGYTTKVENIIFGSFVTKARLGEIVFHTFSNTKIQYATELNVFIDLYSVLHSVFSRTYRTEIDNPLVITSALVNMCAHYRQFFNKLGVATKFFLVYSDNIHTINRKLVFGYNNTFVVKSQIPLFRKIVDANFAILTEMCPYLPDIHFINNTSGYEVAVIIADLIEKINDGNPNLVISKDLYPLQLCYKYPNTSYLFPIKTYDTQTHTSIDQSIMVPLMEKPTHNIAFWNLVCMRRKLDPRKFYELDTHNFMLFEAMHVFPERDMVNLCGTADQVLKILIKEMNGNEGLINVKSMYYHENLNTLPINLIESRVNALDIDFVLPYYQQDPESQSIKLQNLDDNGTINMLNSKYFRDNPINTLNL